MSAPKQTARQLEKLKGWMMRVLKSVAAGILGMALFFCFFMLISIPLLSMVARLHGAPLQAPDVVVVPGPWFHYFGLPLSAAAFFVSFSLGMKKFRNPSQPAISRQ